MLSMKNPLLFIFLVFLLKHKVTYASMCPSNNYSKLNVYLQGFTFESSRVNTILECYRLCEQNILCSTININLTDMTCERKYSTKTRHPEKTVRPVQNMVYMEAKDDLGPPGSRPDRPIPSCKKLKEDDSQAESGVYWMKFNEPSSAPFQVFCDMTTDGGGWTLVWSYTFSNFDNFHAEDNVVTPAPNWPRTPNPTDDWAPQSTKTPLAESSRSAMDFALWNKIGNELLFKCNITNWVSCQEGTGSFVNWRTGTLTCKVVKVMTPTCTTIAPDFFEIWGCGVSFKNLTRGSQIVLDTYKHPGQCKPYHDPCAQTSSGNHLTNVASPGCDLFVR